MQFQIYLFAYLALLNLLKQAPWRDRRHRSTLAWKVLRHASSSVAFRDYRGVLGFAARLLRGREVLLLADRGFAHLDLLGWAGARRAGTTASAVSATCGCRRARCAITTASWPSPLWSWCARAWRSSTRASGGRSTAWRC